MHYPPSLISYKVVDIRGEVLDIVDVIDRQVVRPAKDLEIPIGVLKQVQGQCGGAEKHPGHQPKPNE